MTLCIGPDVHVHGCVAAANPVYGLAGPYSATVPFRAVEFIGR